jgi:dipeptidyl aminopeptidase/acylaminoacyl peptidase
LILLLILPAASISGQPQEANEPLPIEDYTRWRSITGASISADGEWVAYSFRKVKSDDTLYVVSPASDREHMIPLASGARFSDDSRWVAYMLTVPYKEAEKLRKDRKPVPNKAELLNLESGEKRSWDNAASIGFPKGSSHLVIRKVKGDNEAKHDGTDLILRNLREGYEELIGSVSAYAFNKPGSFVAYVVDAADKDGNGVYLIDLRSGARRSLDNGKARYARLTWSEEGEAVTALKGDEEEGLKHRVNSLLAFTGVDEGSSARFEYDPATATDFPDSTVISELGTLSWSTDLTRVFLAIKPQEEKPEEKKDEEEDPKADVNIWHWQDDRIQTVQIQQVQQDQNRTFRSVVDIRKGTLIQLADDQMRTVQLTRDGNWGIGQNNRAYVSDWKPRKADYYRIDTRSGERTTILVGHQRTLGLSPDSKHFLYWKDAHVWDYVIADDRHVNLTASAPVSFMNQEFDRFGERPPYGVAGWSKDGESVLLNHRYDIWQLPLDGNPATNLTGDVGAENEMRLRYVQTDPEERFVDLTEPILLSAYGQWTKKAGFYQLSRGRLRELVYEDCSFGQVIKAKDADTFLYTRQTFAEFPDYWVSDVRFRSPRKITGANPWQSEYMWGHRILFDFTNNDGVRLQGTLAIPDDYVAGEKRPMLVNFYEKNSQSLHRYPTPVHRSSPNFAGYVSNGYLVMQPDVHFRVGSSHSDMLECVEAAIRKVIEMGYVDPERIGLHGHSYSGGGSAYIATRSTMFAAIAHGAAPINLVSEFNQLFDGSGQNNHSYDIYGQGRYATDPFTDFDLYWQQSAISGVQDMNTPVLYLHGEADPTVGYVQALEWYNALRFLEKPIIFLSYPGEGHGLRRLENQIDFQVRVREFFEHHLNGEEAPDWMVNGVSYVEKLKKEGK